MDTFKIPLDFRAVYAISGELDVYVILLTQYHIHSKVLVLCADSGHFIFELRIFVVLSFVYNILIIKFSILL
jgi:hypothetical protein